MKHYSGKRSLEGYKIFPYIAWTLIGLFALFVYNLTNEISAATEQLQQVQAESNAILHIETSMQD